MTPYYNPGKGGKRKKGQADAERINLPFPPDGKKFAVKPDYAIPTRKIPFELMSKTGGMNVTTVEWEEFDLCDLVGYLASRCTWETFKQLFRGNKLLVESCRYASIMYVDKKIQFFGKRKAENTTAFLSGVKSNISTEEMLSLGADADIASIIKSIGILRGRIGDKNKKSNKLVADLKKMLNTKIEIGMQKCTTAEQQAAFRYLGDTESPSDECSQVADRLYYSFCIHKPAENKRYVCPVGILEGSTVLSPDFLKDYKGWQSELQFFNAGERKTANPWVPIIDLLDAAFEDTGVIMNSANNPPSIPRRSQWKPLNKNNPSSLVVRIRRSHRRGRGSIPRLVAPLLTVNADVKKNSLVGCNSVFISRTSR